MHEKYVFSFTQGVDGEDLPAQLSQRRGSQDHMYLQCGHILHAVIYCSYILWVMCMCTVVMHYIYTACTAVNSFGTADSGIDPVQI